MLPNQGLGRLTRCVIFGSSKTLAASSQRLTTFSMWHVVISIGKSGIRQKEECSKHMFNRKWVKFQKNMHQVMIFIRIQNSLLRMTIAVLSASRSDGMRALVAFLCQFLASIRVHLDCLGLLGRGPNWRSNIIRRESRLASLAVITTEDSGSAAAASAVQS